MVLQSSQDGGAAVSVSKRKHKPVKQIKAHKATPSASSPEVRVDVDGRAEIVDPDEERYCICGDVSYGEMICCVFDDKVGVFHMTIWDGSLTRGSASMECGFTWSALSWQSFLHEQSSGTAQVIGRSITKARTQMDWLAEALNKYWK